MIERLEDLWDRIVGSVPYVDDPTCEPEEGETVLALPGYRQTQTYTCGAVAGLMVLHTFHPRRSPRRFIRRTAPVPHKGTPTARLVRALEASGVGVLERHDLDFARIAEWIEDGRPIITLVDRGEYKRHWVVLYGVARRPRRLLVAGNGSLPRLSSHRYPWGDFKRSWTENGFGLVCCGK